VRVPTSFPTRRAPEIEPRAIAARRGVDHEELWRVLEPVESIGWDAVYHAYGPAADVPAQLAAVAVGDDPTRDEAWWNLWSNIHHQGTIYEATLPAVPVLFALAAWHDYPDRSDALLLLREIAAADVVDVWRYDDDGVVVHDRERRHRLFAELRTALALGTSQIAARWRTEPEPFRRALVWLLSVVPEMRERYQPLVDDTLPAGHREAWEAELLGGPASDDEFDALVALEEWVQGRGP
jgi:hypothetical protein